MIRPMRSLTAALAAALLLSACVVAKPGQVRTHKRTHGAGAPVAATVGEQDAPPQSGAAQDAPASLVGKRKGK
jgi:hypothetical protein